MAAKAWRVNPRDDDGQLSLGDISQAGGGYFVVAVPTGMDDEYAAHLMSAAELMKDALLANDACSNHVRTCQTCGRIPCDDYRDLEDAWLELRESALAAAGPALAVGEGVTP